MYAPTFLWAEKKSSGLRKRLMSITGFKAYKEWNKENFCEFITDYGFTVVKVNLVDGGFSSCWSFDCEKKLIIKFAEIKKFIGEGKYGWKNLSRWINGFSDLETHRLLSTEIFLDLNFQGEIFMEGEETDKMFHKENCKARVDIFEWFEGS